ncbi:putative F-box domain, leucine-rich repeat domain superfamily, F-box-like domain superfamily [Helianthus annuus]|nr:putative F-box domain, leucine-rich repeat domain superfamily, F-box-like domain superfamily [Helianthus annuus]
MARKAFKFAPPKDVISSMPDNVVTHILDRLPIQDAVNTSILSRNWRFKWTLLSQLVFDENFLKYLAKRNGVSKFGRIISRLLLHLKGTITKFVLYIDKRSYSALDDEDIAYWILFLSRKGVEDLTITKTNGEALNLPAHLFSCLELKHLKLRYCFFKPPTSFHGFPKLLNLELDLLDFETDKFGEFITQCPLLEILNMRNQHHLLETSSMDYYFSVGKAKLVDIAKLANIKRLSLSLSDTEMVRDSSSIFELVGFFPKLQELNLDFVRYKLTKDSANKKCPTAFPCLKTLKLSTIDVYDGLLLSCALELIRSCPNLQTLEILANDLDRDPTYAKCSPYVDYNATGLLQLRSVDVSDVKDSVIEVCLIKYLLACSPFLKRFVIRPSSHLSSDEKLRFARKLLKLHRASLTVEIDLL